MNRSPSRLSFVAAFAATTAVLALAPAAAHAEGPAQPRSAAPQPLEQAPSATAWGIAGYQLGLGVGARMTLPAADGLLKDTGASVRDVFALDIGADYLRFRAHGDLADADASILRPVAGVLWAFRLGEHLALYPKLELGWNVARSEARGPETAARHAGMHLEGIAGLLVTLGGFSLRAESGWGYLKAGVGFAI